MNSKAHVHDRATTPPNTVWDCEACNTPDSMEIRRSSLNEQFYADDISFKCMECWHVRVHGVPFDTPSGFEDELSGRDGRVLDFAQDGHDPAGQLAALGYTGKAEVEGLSDG